MWSATFPNSLIPDGFSYVRVKLTLSLAINLLRRALIFLDMQSLQVYVSRSIQAIPQYSYYFWHCFKMLPQIKRFIWIVAECVKRDRYYSHMEVDPSIWSQSTSKISMGKLLSISNHWSVVSLPATWEKEYLPSKDCY